jgi:hypothetical protein
MRFGRRKVGSPTCLQCGKRANVPSLRYANGQGRSPNQRLRALPLPGATGFTVMAMTVKPDAHHPRQIYFVTKTCTHSASTSMATLERNCRSRLGVVLHADEHHRTHAQSFEVGRSPKADAHAACLAGQPSLNPRKVVLCGLWSGWSERRLRVASRRSEITAVECRQRRRSAPQRDQIPCRADAGG